MKAKILVSAVMVSVAFAPASFAGHKSRHGPQHDSFTDYARVVNVEPIMRTVTLSVPQKECWDERVSYPQYNSYSSDSAGKMILGGIIGGVIGSRFGGGHGRHAATVAGTLIGASIGHDAAGHKTTVVGSRMETVQRCHVSQQQHTEERVDGYRVTYRYKGERFSTRMPYDPGNKIRVRVNVTPLE